MSSSGSVGANTALLSRTVRVPANRVAFMTALLSALKRVRAAVSPLTVLTGVDVHVGNRERDGDEAPCRCVGLGSNLGFGASVGPRLLLVSSSAGVDCDDATDSLARAASARNALREALPVPS